MWDELTGQATAIAAVRAAAERGEGMTHAWLLTGPPGSGRSTLAYAFAAALLAPADADPAALAAVEAQVAAKTHPDLAALSTDRVVITIDEVRQLVAASAFSPSVGRYRVMVVEDADRMTERTSNVLLKALEEPPPRTVWILCAPSEADLLPTIRSRVRSVRLRVPGVEDVAALLVRRDGVPAALAEQCARHAQSHIGMAHRLATDERSRERRARSLELAIGIRSAAGAVLVAAELLELAGEDASALTEQRDAAEREDALRSLGVEPGGTVPPALRAQLKQLEDDQKRRATRSLRDALDRILVDLLSLYRDVLLRQLGLPAAQLVNTELAPRIDEAAARGESRGSLDVLDALVLARRRIAGNVAPALALEAALVSAAAASGPPPTQPAARKPAAQDPAAPTPTRGIR